LLIEVEPSATPITGTLQRQPHGQIEPFTGWLQLTEALETARRASTPDTDEQSTTARWPERT
jgi:hypothetical protein